MVVGKTNLDQFGMGSHSTNSHFGAVHAPEPLYLRSAGGSSGGSAVAVKEGEADLALGTDTGGSVRLPAAYTGTVGFKPSYGMISRWGVIPYANSLDTVGFLAKDVSSIQNVVTGVPLLHLEHDPRDPTSMPAAARERCMAQREGYSKTPVRPGRYSVDFGGLTFGIPLECNVAELSPEIRSSWLSTANHAQHLGARVVPVSLPTTKHALSAYYVIAPAEASSNLAKYDGIRYGSRSSPSSPPPSGVSSGDKDASEGNNEQPLYAATRGEHFGEEVKRRILLGAYTLSSAAMDNYFIQAQKVRRLVRRDFDRVFRLANPLHEPETYDLADLPEEVELQNRLGPSQVDFLLCPTAPTLSPRIEDVVRRFTPLDSYVNDVFTVPASLAGLPAISLPVPVAGEEGASGAEDEPPFVGMQLIGQFWDDARLLSVADTLMKTAAR